MDANTSGGIDRAIACLAAVSPGKAAVMKRKAANYSSFAPAPAVRPVPLRSPIATVDGRDIRASRGWPVSEAPDASPACIYVEFYLTFLPFTTPWFFAKPTQHDKRGNEQSDRPFFEGSTPFESKQNWTIVGRTSIIRHYRDCRVAKIEETGTRINADRVRNEIHLPNGIIISEKYMYFTRILFRERWLSWAIVNASMRSRVPSFLIKNTQFLIKIL